MKKPQMQVTKTAEKTKETPAENKGGTAAEANAQGNEVAALKAEIQKLKDALKNQPQSLEERIEYFRKKQEQMERLAKLDQYAQNLITVGEQVKEKVKEDEYFNDTFSFRIVQKSGYSTETDVLKIHNPRLILELLEFAMEKINEKRETLKAAIEA